MGNSNTLSSKAISQNRTEQSHEEQNGTRNFKKNRNTCVVEPTKEETKTSDKSLADEHRVMIESVKLAIDIVDAKLSNNLGFAYLLL